MFPRRQIRWDRVALGVTFVALIASLYIAIFIRWFKD
jgi:hypothetical protein